MNAVLDMKSDSDEGLSLAPKLQELHGHCTTRRIEELEALVDRLRAALLQAEMELEREKARTPEIGDFVRCPLTNFFGRVTKVTPRPNGRSWIEIIPYLGRDIPGHGAMDLYDSWELIDPPTDDEDGWPPVKNSQTSNTQTSTPQTSPGLPRVSSFDLSARPSVTAQPKNGEDGIELALRKLWIGPEEITS